MPSHLESSPRVAVTQAGDRLHSPLPNPVPVPALLPHKARGGRCWGICHGNLSSHQSALVLPQAAVPSVEASLCRLAFISLGSGPSKQDSGFDKSHFPSLFRSRDESSASCPRCWGARGLLFACPEPLWCLPASQAGPHCSTLATETPFPSLPG